MADLPAAGAAAGTGLPHRVGGEVILVHIPLGGLPINAVQQLGLLDGAQGGDGKHLGLATGEHTGAVDAGDDANFGGQGTDLVHLAAVHPLALLQQPPTDDKLLELIEALANYSGALVFRVELRPDVLLDGLEVLVPQVLIVGIQGGHHPLLGVFLHRLKEVVVHLLGFKGELGLADLRLDPLDELHHLLNLGKALHDGRKHHIVGHLFGAGLDHADLFIGTGHHQGQVALGPLLRGGGEDNLPVHQTDIDAGDGTIPGNIRDGKGKGGANHPGDFRLAVRVNGQNRHHHCDVVAHILGEEGADRPVHHTGGENGLIRGTALPFQEGAGDFAHRVELFLKVHRKGQEINAIPGLFGGGGVHQHGGFAVPHQDRASGQAAHLAGFKGDLFTGKLSFKYAEMFKHSVPPKFFGPLPSGRRGRVPLWRPVGIAMTPWAEGPFSPSSDC